MILMRILIISLVLFGFAATASAQTEGGLKKVETTERAKEGGNIEYNKEEVEARQAPAIPTQAKTVDNSFKRKKSMLDKAKVKLYKLKNKYIAKKESGQWTTEKFNTMMAKLTKKEVKLDQKKQDFIKNIAEKMHKG